MFDRLRGFEKDGVGNCFKNNDSSVDLPHGKDVAIFFSLNNFYRSTKQCIELSLLWPDLSKFMLTACQVIPNLTFICVRSTRA